MRQIWHLESLGFNIICEELKFFNFYESSQLIYFYYSLDGLPFQNEEFDFVYVIFFSSVSDKISAH